MGDRWDLVHLWSASASEIPYESIGLKVGPTFSYETGWDMSNNDHMAVIRDLQRRFRPRVIVAQPEVRLWKVAVTRPDKYQHVNSPRSIHDSNIVT